MIGRKEGILFLSGNQSFPLRFTAQEEHRDDIFAGTPAAMRCMANENREVFTV